MRDRSLCISFTATIIVMMMSTVNAYAEDDAQSLQDEVQALRKEVAELRALIKQQSVAQDEVHNLRKEVKETARVQSEWVNTESVAHLSGYAAVGYSDRRQGGAFDVARFNPIFHYQYRDIALAEAELEIEVDADGGTETKLEYGTIDIFLNDYATLVAGKFLSPLGSFRQNIHPAWINKFPSTPTGFGGDQAAPVAELGLGVRGGYLFGDEKKLKYALYVGNGPELEVEGGAIRSINSDGFARDSDRRKVVGTRIGLVPLPKLEFGLSAAGGGVGLSGEADRRYRVYGSDASYQWKNLDLRGEYIGQKVGDLASSSVPQGGTWKAWYGQAAYRFLPSKWEGVVRYGKYQTPHADQRQRQWALGVNYLWGPNLLAKLGYEFNQGQQGAQTDANRWLLQFAYGF